MLIDVIAGAGLLISLVGIGIIVGRKFPTMAAISPNPNAGVMAERKKNLIEDRLRRKVSDASKHLSSTLSPLQTRSSAWWQNVHKKLVDLEHEYKVRSLPVFLSRRQRHKVNREVNNLLSQAQEFINDGEFVAAEEKALQAIRYEPRSVPAFELLGQLYQQTNELNHAKEVYRYLLKLMESDEAISAHPDHPDQPGLADSHSVDETNSQLETVYLLNLTKIDRLLGKWDLAFERIQTAIRQQPNNPKILDEYLEVCIGYGKKQFAEDALEKIKQVNPENTKITEWQERIRAIGVKPLANTPDSDRVATDQP